MDESALVLPAALRRDLMACVDAFLTSPTGSDHRSPSRGMLLLGRPGTGKTLTTRHLLCRLGDARRYLFVRATTGTSPFDSRTFERMVQAIEADDAPAVVVIEDVDRLFEGGSTTPQYFLNVLDGMLEPSAPVLWIATSNDPTGIAPNLSTAPAASTASSSSHSPMTTPGSTSFGSTLSIPSTTIWPGSFPLRRLA